MDLGVLISEFGICHLDWVYESMLRLRLRHHSSKQTLDREM